MKNWWPTVSKNRSHVREGGPTSKGISVLLNRKTEPSLAAVVGYDRFVGEQAYRQLTELYRALRRSRQLLPALNETPIEATRWEKSALCLRFSEDPPATVAPVRSPPCREAAGTDRGGIRA
jgi:hypothetical protein